MQIPLLGRTGIALVLVGFALDFIPVSIWRHDSSSLLISALLFALGILLLFAWSVTQFNRKSDAGRSPSQLPPTAWLGIVAVFLGLPFYAGIQYWMDTRTFVSWVAYHDYDEIYGGVRWLSGMFSAIGLVLVIQSFGQGRPPAEQKLTPGFSPDVAAGGYLSGRRPPPKTKFLTLPAFGLLYAPLLAILLLFLFAAFTYNRRTSQGLLVFLPGFQVSTHQGENGPVIVRIDARNRWYVNSKRVQREELPDAIKDSLSRQPDWIVYVDADPDLEVQQVVDAIDVLQSMHVKVALVTPQMKTHKLEHRW